MLPKTLALTLLLLPSVATAEKKVATLDKTGTFHGTGSIHDPRPDPKSNGDLQQMRWDAHEGFERLVLDLHENVYGSRKTPPLKTPGYYKITNETFPCRIVCDLNGRQANALLGLPDLSKSPLIKDIYRIVVLDDASVKFAIDLKAPAEIEVFELHEPARIVIDLRPVSERRYSVRTPAVDGGEGVGSMEEELFAAGFRTNRILRCIGGKFCVEAGIFTDEKAAKDLAGQIAAKGIPVMVEERAINAPPKGS